MNKTTEVIQYSVLLTAKFRHFSNSQMLRISEKIRENWNIQGMYGERKLELGNHLDLDRQKEEMSIWSENNVNKGIVRTA